MKADEIDQLARHNDYLPEEAGLADMMLHSTLILLYREWKLGAVTTDEAKIRKKRAIEKHSSLETKERIYEQHNKRIVELDVIAQKAFTEHSCPLCVKMYDIFSGYRGRENKENG